MIMEQTLLRRYSIDKMVSLYEKTSDMLFASWRRNQLSNTDFSIVSNNCWGGHVYRWFGLPYSSPTVGLYFYSEDYIRFLENLKSNIYGKLTFIDVAESRHRDDLLRKGQENVPIGLINDQIEVVFLHYHSREEAYEKWRRRSERWNEDNIIVKFSQMNECTEDHLREFQKMGFNKKLLFLSSPLGGGRRYRYR